MRESLKVPASSQAAGQGSVRSSDDSVGASSILGALFDAHPLPLIVTTADTGEVLAANAMTAAVSGFAAAQLTGRSVFEFGHYLDADDRATQMASLEGRPASGREMLLRGADDQPLRMLAHTSRIVVDGRDCYLTAFTDISALPRIDDGHLAAQRQDVVGQISGGVAHEFNNLLTVMQGHIDAMSLDAALTAGLRQRVEGLGRAVAQATRVTSGLLTFAGRNPTAATVIDLHAALDSLRPLVAGTVGPAIDLQWQLAAAPASARIAHSHVAQVVLNLTLNAREAMPGGGRLDVTTSVVGDARPDDGVTGAGPWVCLEITDTGRGMSEDVRRHAFDPFFTTKGPGRGIGLGLSICRGIAQQAGGHIAVHSVAGAGTRVRCYLPWVALPERALDGPRPAITGRVILLVEDEADVRHIVAEILRRAGHVVHQADGLAAAEAQLDRLGGIDLLLTDLVLPGANGLEVARRVRRRHPDVPILFMSGYSENVFSGGEVVEHLLQKPFTSRTLLDTLAALFTA